MPERLLTNSETRQADAAAIRAGTAGAVLMERDDYVALTGDQRVNDGAVWLKPGGLTDQSLERLGLGALTADWLGANVF